MKDPPWIPGALAGVILGAVLGFLGSLITTRLSNRRQDELRRLDQAEKREREVEKRLRWITSNLPAQLQNARVAVREGVPTKFEMWLKMLLDQGYFGEIQTWSKQRNPNLAQDLIEVSASLQNYKDRRTQNIAMSASYKTNLDQELSTIIDKLGQLE